MSETKKTTGYEYIAFALLTLIVWGINSSPLVGVFAEHRVLTLIGALVIGASAIFLLLRKNRTPERVAFVFMLVSFAVRASYVISMPFNISPHDLGGMTGTMNVSSGHLGYVEYIYNYHKLPDFDPRTLWAFYNPPFHHIVTSVWYSINRLLGFNLTTSLENLQILSLSICTVAIYVTKAIIDEFKIRKSVKMSLYMLAAFYPPLIWMSASLSNDPLSLLLMLTSILFTLKWYKEQKLSYIIGIALSIGLGMMTKLTVAYVAFSTAYIFLVILIRAIKDDKSKVKNLILQYGIFGLICVPLGLFWPIRCKVLFDMPFNFIQRMPEGCQYVGDFSLWQRLGIPTMEQLGVGFVRIDENMDCNIWWTAFKSFLFDEEKSMKPFTVALSMINDMTVKFLMVLFAVIIGLSIYALVKKSKRLDVTSKVYLILIAVPVFVSYIIFNFEFPNICTMNARYIAVIYIVPVILSGVGLSKINNEKLNKYFCVGTSVMCVLLTLLWSCYAFTLNPHI